MQNRHGEEGRRSLRTLRFCLAERKTRNGLAVPDEGWSSFEELQQHLRWLEEELFEKNGASLRCRDCKEPAKLVRACVRINGKPGEEVVLKSIDFAFCHSCEPDLKYEILRTVGFSIWDRSAEPEEVPV